LKPAEFWEITPYILNIAIDGFKTKSEREHSEHRWLVWHGAALTRMKKMVDFHSFVGIKKNSSKKIDEGAIIARLKEYNRRLANEQ
jgi:hypothetical protein